LVFDRTRNVIVEGVDYEIDDQTEHLTTMGTITLKAKETSQ
jgi:hypothetical protein